MPLGLARDACFDAYRLRTHPFPCPPKPATAQRLLKYDVVEDVVEFFGDDLNAKYEKAENDGKWFGA